MDDPIIAAIEAHRAVHSAWRHAAADAPAPDHDRGTAADALHARAEAAAWALLDVTPTSPAGLLALVTYAADFVVDGNDWPDGWDRRFYAVVVGWPGA
ncbi:hypothetical protein PQJ75_03265 [Rhodoplanes sp. TEM]|uniref:Uncharacterized protein n=1 Tax=Rhodoplanes tepidamans TaxID=200616 RepID=A0ABT5JHD3_RHOTP|nr:MULTISPECIES: hypothetical protein [Rhodoplanes]MDC7789121.1 hypothetical protein [Rhodoplanes tepidamans]MDC7982738.1 hypothetical protein [Rhodoplanes sp. TEM]MDQ0357433.1 hypothetical protein [Rhodoplanes tepidamans]